LTSVGGVTFALLLMILQLDFRAALLDSSTELLRQIDADVLVTAVGKRPFLSRDRMRAERLYQAAAIEGVSAAHPLWLDLLFWKNLEDGVERPIRVIGFVPGDSIFLIDEVNAVGRSLQTRGTAMVDSRSRSDYGRVDVGSAQVSRRELEIVGTFPLGTDFEVDGNLIVGDETYFMLSGQGRHEVEIAALKLEPGADPQGVVSKLRAALPNDVSVYTKNELLERDLEYWRRGTPISILLLVGVVLGFAVGVVICYQILYTDVIDHLAEFATLRAIGYGNAYIRWVVIVEAWALSLLGFAPAALLGAVLQQLLGGVTGLPVHFSWSAFGMVLALSMAMCTASGIFALRRTKTLDPAELF
jgi:putative ABC transport system permease protein